MDEFESRLYIDRKVLMTGCDCAVAGPGVVVASDGIDVGAV